MTPETRAFGVDYIAGGQWHHTVVMAQHEIAAGNHVRAAQASCTIMRVKRLRPPAGFTLAR